MPSSSEEKMRKSDSKQEKSRDTMQAHQGKSPDPQRRPSRTRMYSSGSGNSGDDEQTTENTKKMENMLALPTHERMSSEEKLRKSTSMQETSTDTMQAHHQGKSPQRRPSRTRTYSSGSGNSGGDEQMQAPQENSTDRQQKKRSRSISRCSRGDEQMEAYDHEQEKSLDRQQKQTRMGLNSSGSDGSGRDGQEKVNAKKMKKMDALTKQENGDLGSSTSSVEVISDGGNEIQMECTGNAEKQGVTNSHPESQLIEYDDQIKKLVQALNKFARRNAALEAKFKETETSLKAKINDFEDQNQQLKAHVDEQNARIDEQNAHIDEQNARIDEQNAHIDEQNARLDDLDKLVQQLLKKQPHEDSAQDVVLPLSTGHGSDECDTGTAHAIQMNLDNGPPQTDLTPQEAMSPMNEQFQLDEAAAIQNSDNGPPQIDLTPQEPISSTNEQLQLDVADASNIQEVHGYDNPYSQQDSCPPDCQTDEEYLPCEDREPPTEGKFIWPIQKFNECREDAKSGKKPFLTSLPFFTGSPGYKVCATIYLNGKETSIDNTVVRDAFLNCHLMKGRFDEELSFPFKPEVSISVFNYEEHDWEISECSLTRDQSAFEQPTSHISNPHVECFLPDRYFHEKYTEGDIFTLRIEICIHE